MHACGASEWELHPVMGPKDGWKSNYPFDFDLKYIPPSQIPF